MNSYLGRSLLASVSLWGVLAAAGCGSEGGDKEKSTSAATSQCQKELKAQCGYDEKETACSSLMTPVIPLTGGGTWGNVEVQQGPYGSIVDWNQGAEFRTPESSGEMGCALTVQLFGEPQAVTNDILDLRGADLGLFTVFRPACMKDGEKYPVITWGNGTCGQTGGYATLLATLASHGFVVVASNSRFTGTGRVMQKALDFAEAANEDESSPLYQRLDLDKIGAMGHSQGAGATEEAASDPRIDAVILWNGAATSSQKPFLSVTGDRDITFQTPASLGGAVDGASQRGAWLYYHQVLDTGGFVTGHLTLMEQPERVTEVTIAWWKFMLNDDAEAKKMFVGEDCGLCNSPAEFEYGHNAAL